MLVATGSLVACGGDEGDSQSQSNAATDDPPVAQVPPPSSPPSQPVNSAPTIAGKPPSQILVGDSLDFTPTANDADGDVLTFSVQNLPQWASFDSKTGRISGTPSESDAGTYPNITISVTDGAVSANLAPFSITVVFNAMGTATLSWTAPTQKTDGSPVELDGFVVYWGTSSRKYSHSVKLGINSLTYVVDNLTPATWYFAVTALDRNGLESVYSNEAMKVIR